MPTDDDDIAIEAIMAAVQKYAARKFAFGMAYEGDREEAKERNGRELEPLWDAIRASAQDVLAERDERIARLSLTLRQTIAYGESWIHDRLDGTSLLEGALAELEPARALLAEMTDEQPREEA